MGVLPDGWVNSGVKRTASSLTGRGKLWSFDRVAAWLMALAAVRVDRWLDLARW